MKKTFSKINLTKYKLKKSNSYLNFGFVTSLKTNYEQFNKKIQANMSFYNMSESSDINQTKLFFAKTPNKLGQKEKDLIKLLNYEKYASRNKKNNSSMHTVNNDINIEVNSYSNNPDEINYMNPLHSLSVISINNKVRSNIMKLNLKRQQNIFNKSIYNYEKIKNRYIGGLIKIKISKLSPINNTNNILTKKISNNNMIPSLRQNSLRNIFKPHENKNLFFFHMYTRLNASFENRSKNYPVSREQFTFVSNDDSNNIYLIGGISCINECNEIWKYDIDYLSWEKIKSKNMTKCRYGHTAILNKTNSKIYIFGGVSKLDIWKNNITKGGEENYGNFEVFDLIKKEWCIPIKTKFHPEFRRNHTCELVGNDLVILMGINKENEVINDVSVLNISFPFKENERWEEVLMATDSIAPRLYGHTSALVLDEEILENKKYGIYYIPDEFKQKKIKGKYRNNGIYVFGGKNKFTDGNLSNDIYLFHIGQNPCWWEKLENVKGIRPSPRYMHSMNYYKPGNFLIIHGGKNINSLNDTFLFDLVNYHWNKIILTGIDESLILPRHGHQSAICANQLFIFGGANNGSYIGSSMFIINLIPNVLNMLLMSVISKRNSNEVNLDNKKEKGKDKKIKLELDNINKEKGKGKKSILPKIK